MAVTDILLVFFVLLQFGDIYTTYRILKSGGRELNPVMARLFDSIGLVPALIIVKTAAIVAVWLVDNIYLTGVLCVIYAAVIEHNARQFRK